MITVSINLQIVILINQSIVEPLQKTEIVYCLFCPTNSQNQKDIQVKMMFGTLVRKVT